MLTLVLIAVGFAVSIAVFVGLAMLLDVTVGGGKRAVEEREQEARRWQPPFATDGDLFRWARSKARQVVGDALRAERSARMPEEITRELHSGANRAMLPIAPDHRAARAIPCPEDGQGLIGVSALEAIGLAAYLRERLSPEEVERIYWLSRDNMERLEEGKTLARSLSPCSLQGEACMCQAYEARPLQCRPLHAAVIADRLGVEALGGNGGPESWAAHADAIRRGLGDGVVSGLDDAGLDSNVYELHAALVTALETPDVAERWMNGEDLFKDCLLQDHGSSEHLF